MAELTHFDAKGDAHMVDVGAKAQTKRIARARGEIHMAPATFALCAAGTAKKGDVIGVARIAAIMASVLPQVTTISPLGSMSRPMKRDCFFASASRKSCAPQVMEY